MDENNYNDEFRDRADPEINRPEAPAYEPSWKRAAEPPFESAFSDDGRKKKSGMSAGGIVALALCCALLGGAVGTAGTFFALRSSAEAPEAAVSSPAPAVEATQAPAVPTETRPAPAASSGEKTLADVYTENVDSTVGITTSITTNYWGYRSTSAASGSGFILTEDGYILTNYHVIEDSDSVTVTTYDDESYAAEIVGYDSGNDIAVLKIDAHGLKPVALGSSDDLRVGDTVVAIGNPLGELTFSLTQGVVSALHREITLSNGTTLDLIQTDAAINSGNSGGALFNMKGEVVGITNAKYSSSGASSSASIDNIGFAIPIDHVRSTVFSIIENGYIVKPYIGVSVTPVSSDMIAYGLPKGALVKVVNEDSPAQAAGLQINDVITAVNGKEISSGTELVNIVGACTPGDELVLSVYRQGGETLDITVIVGEQQQSALQEKTAQQQQQLPQGFPFGFGWGWGNAG